MAYVDEIKRRGYDGGVYFVGSFASGAEVRWATRAVAVSGTLPGLAEPRLLSFPTISHGMGETWDAELEIPSCTIDLDNADGALAPYLIGCDPSDPASSEYTGDNFLNLRGYLVHFAVRDGTHYTQQISPYLYASGGIDGDDVTIRLTLTAKGAGDLTSSIYGEITVRHLLDSAAGAASGAILAARGFFPARTSIPVGVEWIAPGVLTQGDFSALLVSLEGAADADPETPLSFIFGRSFFRPVAIGAVPTTHGRGVLQIVGLTVEPPAPGTLADWNAAPAASEEWASHVASDGHWPAPYAYAQLGYIERDVLCDDGSTRAVWVIFAVGHSARPNGVIAEDPEIGSFLPAPDAELGLASGEVSTPAALIERVLEDLAPSTLAITTADFTRAKASQAPRHAGSWGGSIYGSADIADAVSVIAGAGHVGLWIDRVGSIRCLAYPGWDSGDLADAATSLPIIRDADIIGDPAVVEVLPIGENDRGAAASEVSIAWTQDQADAIPARFRNDRAFGAYAPGAKGFAVPAVLRGDWINPRAGNAPLRAAVAHRSRFARRLEITTRLWVGAGYDAGQLFRLSTTFGRGGAGYSNRLVRLEHAQLDPGQDAASCRFEDLGPIEGLRPVVLDDEDNWIRHNSAGTARSLALSSASTTVTASGGTPFAGVVAGDHLWTFGSAKEENRVSKRIASRISDTQITVESVYHTTEAALAASAGGTGTIDTAWCVMLSQESKSPTNATKLTVCDESDNQFRDGSAGFVVGG